MCAAAAAENKRVFRKDTTRFWDSYANEEYIFVDVDTFPKSLKSLWMFESWLQKREAPMGCRDKDAVVIIPSFTRRVFVSNFSPEEFHAQCKDKAIVESDLSIGNRIGTMTHLQ